MESPAVEHRVPSGLLRNEWADVPFVRVVVWKVLVVLFWAQLFAWPVRPRTLIGVTIALAGALILAVPLAWLTIRIGSPVFHNPVARRLALRTDDRAPGARIAYMLAASVAGGLLLWGLVQTARGAAQWMTARAPRVPAFLASHFW
jgi:hypothetical protein